MGAAKQTIFVGFDSAWADKPDGPGAICSIAFLGDRFSDFSPPEMVGFGAALTYINRLQRSDAATFVALDQPTIVPNRTGMRPVEKAAASLISWLGGGVQPANRGKTMFFGDEAPIWRFIEKLEAIEDPEAARVAAQGEYLMEVFPRRYRWRHTARPSSGTAKGRVTTRTERHFGSRIGSQPLMRRSTK
jgi:predicted RNase H-like nuclease